MMRHREHLNHILASRVNEIVGKAIQGGAAKATCGRRTACGKGVEAAESCFDSISEAAPKTGNGVFIEVDGRHQLITSRRMKLVDHRRKRRSISANTSLAGTPRTRPEVRSVARLDASSFQASSTPVSVGSRLAIKSSARRARSEVGSSRSCLARASALRSTMSASENRTTI